MGENNLGQNMPNNSTADEKELQMSTNGYCTVCGAELPYKSGFCAKCGAKSGGG